jgi:hypothetical protein
MFVDARVPESPRIPGREDSPFIDYVATGREIGTSKGIFSENEAELAVGSDRYVVVAPGGGRSHGGTVGVDLASILQVMSRSEELEEEVPETAGENPPFWTRGGMDRPSGGGGRGEEEAQGQDGGDHEPYQGFPAHVRTLFRAGRRQGLQRPAPPALQSRIVCGPDRRRDHCARISLRPREAGG